MKTYHSNIPLKVYFSLFLVFSFFAPSNINAQTDLNAASRSVPTVDGGEYKLPDNTVCLTDEARAAIKIQGS